MSGLDLTSWWKGGWDEQYTVFLASRGKVTLSNAGFRKEVGGFKPQTLSSPCFSKAVQDCLDRALKTCKIFKKDCKNLFNPPFPPCYSLAVIVVNLCWEKDGSSLSFSCGPTVLANLGLESSQCMNSKRLILVLHIFSLTKLLKPQCKHTMNSITWVMLITHKAGMAHS